MELLFNNISAISDRGITQISLLIRNTEVRAGRAATLESIPSKQDRTTIDATGLLMLPALNDHLSWVSSKYRESDLKRLRQKLAEGGITNGFFEPIENISRVTWLDIGRRLYKTFDNTYGLYGHHSYVSRWSRLVGKEIPQTKVLLSVDSLQNNKQIALCHAQEHRVEQLHKNSPAVKLWWMEKQQELIVEDIGNKNLTQEIINEKIAAPEVERQLLDQIQDRDILKIGATLENHCPYLLSLLLNRKLEDKNGVLGVSLRSNNQRRKLVQEMIADSKPLRIAVGDYSLEWESDIINHGYNIGGFALPLLIDVMNEVGAEMMQIFDKLYTEGKFFESAKIRIPRNFVLIGKGGSREIENSDNQLPQQFRVPKYRVRYTVSNGDLLFSTD